MAERLWSPEFADAVSCLQADVDLVQAEAIEMARYLALAPPAKRVYDAHNPEFLLQRRLSEATRGRTAAAYSRLQWRRLERFERGAVLGSRLSLAVSHHDANQLRALARGACVAVVPNGLRTSAFQFREPDQEAAPNLLFVGKLDYRPNADAVRWLIEHVLPRVFSTVPKARLFVVGANPPEWLVKAGQHDDRIAVTGYVADERPYLERCCALLLPVQVAAGSRLKALVALASGVPIVSTALGMEGLEAEAGQHYLRAEAPEEWIDAVNRVIGATATRVALASAGRRLVDDRYEWDAIRPVLHEAYARIGL
jgi:glycosyltransferase involved in cell wall biosynthesis